MKSTFILVFILLSIVARAQLIDTTLQKLQIEKDRLLIKSEHVTRNQKINLGVIATGTVLTVVTSTIYGKYMDEWYYDNDNVSAKSKADKIKSLRGISFSIVAIGVYGEVQGMIRKYFINKRLRQLY